LAICTVALFCLPNIIVSQPAESREAQLFNAVAARCIGPANMGGRVVEIAAVESNPAVFYFAAATGGIWKTTDSGTTWNPVFDQSGGSLCMGAVAAAQSNPAVVWAGTGEGNILRSMSAGDGVYKSTDGGQTWKFMGLKESRQVARIVIHPKNADIVYVAAMGHAFGGNPERGVYKTADGGKTWQRVLYLDDSTGCTDLAMDPSEADVLYACMYTYRRDAMSGSTPRTEYGPNAGLYKSIDGGKSWERLKNGLPTSLLGRCGISVYRKNPNTVFAIVQTNQGGKGKGMGGAAKGGDNASGIFRSDDKGATWARVSNHYPSPEIGFYFGQIRVDPNDDQRVYVLAVSFTYSTDGGKTFSNAQAGHADHHALWINPKNSDHLILGNDGGLYVSKNRAKTFQAIRGFAIGQFYGICVDMRKPYHVYGGLQDNGSWGGPSATHNETGIALADWRTIGGGDGFYCQADPNDPNTVYCESQMGALQRVDLKAGGGGGMGMGGGKGIRPKGGDYRFNWNSPILLSPHDSKTVYFGGQYLFKSPDRGDNWEKVSPDLSRGGVAADTGHTITTIAESPKKAGVLWVGTDDGRVHISRDGGKNWTEVTKNVPILAKEKDNFSWITRVHCSEHAEGTAYLTVDRHRNDDLKPYAYKTTDYGASWKSVSGDLPKEGNLHCIRDSSKNPNLLFVGTEWGVYGSLDGGQRWHHMKTGIPPKVLVHDLLIHPRDRDLVIGTHGRSIYVVDISHLEQMTPNVLASDVHLFDVRPATAFEMKKGGMDAGYAAPNPPYGATICYYLKDAAKQPVTINLIDPKSGKTFASLKGEQGAGLQKVAWDLREVGGDKRLVAPGQYTVQLVVGEKTLRTTVRVEAPE